MYRRLFGAPVSHIYQVEKKWSYLLWENSHSICIRKLSFRTSTIHVFKFKFNLTLIEFLWIQKKCANRFRNSKFSIPFRSTSSSRSNLFKKWVILYLEYVIHYQRTKHRRYNDISHRSNTNIYLKHKYLENQHMDIKFLYKTIKKKSFFL